MILTFILTPDGDLVGMITISELVHNFKIQSDIRRMEKTYNSTFSF